jgi:hypothetical protein
LGDPDLSPPAEEPSSVLAGRGLVVFPPPEPPRRRGLTWYAPFLLTVALGALVVLVVVLAR